MGEASRPKKVLVSGCYDLLHGGHIAFFESAAKYGDLYVCLGSDRNVRLLKGHGTQFNERERLYMVQAIRFVHEARIASGSGLLDYEPDMAEIRPDYFVVNSDGGSEAKRRLCEKYGVAYVELPREPKAGLPARSSSGIKKELAGETKPSPLPYRLCLAGGWMDQPFVSKYAPGSVVVVSIEPTREFNLRSGMATSTRQQWAKIGPNVLRDQPEELAKLLFGFENPPGTKYVAGSQDAIGLTHGGISRLVYDGAYWPTRIDRCVEPEICDWVQRHIRLVELFARPAGYDPLLDQRLSRDAVERLGRSGNECWEAILRKDLKGLGAAMTATHDAWREILPLTTSPQIDAELNRFADVSTGRITSGCGGGYIFLATDRGIPGSFGIEVRR